MSTAILAPVETGAPSAPVENLFSAATTEILYAQSLRALALLADLRSRPLLVQSSRDTLLVTPQHELSQRDREAINELGGLAARLIDLGLAEDPITAANPEVRAWRPTRRAAFAFLVRCTTAGDAELLPLASAWAFEVLKPEARPA